MADQERGSLVQFAGCDVRAPDVLVEHESLLSPGGRPFESLDGRWHFTLDVFDEGLGQSWPGLEDVPLSEWRLPRDFEIAGGSLIDVPSCWNMVRPEWKYFEGRAWYTKHFPWQPARRGERVILSVGAANYEARIYLNGCFLGRHRGGSTPFCVELTRDLRQGENRLQIAVENRRRPDRIPPERVDWFNYGGLYREIGLLRLPPVFIREAAIGLAPDRSLFTIRAEVTLSDPVSGIATIEIPELCIAQPFTIEQGWGMAVISGTPELWSPARPKLYDVEIRFDDDVVKDRVGFREIRVRGEELLLNGKPIYLRGICVHEDDVVLGKASSEEDVRRRFRHARELNCNFLRLAHYPHHERVARIADELGFLLWEEIPVYWDADFGNSDTYRDAENQLLELIRRDRNRASVILWGIGNETPLKEERHRFMANLAAAARRADNSRLVCAASFVHQNRIQEPMDPSLDVIGINEYYGWYDPDFAALERALAESNPGKPVIISETGADALASLHGDKAVLSTEERQAEIYRRQFEILNRRPYICGVTPWLLYDFRSERRQSAVQKGFNRKGLIAEDKVTRKLAFSVLAGIYDTIRAKRG